MDSGKYFEFYIWSLIPDRERGLLLSVEVVPFLPEESLDNGLSMSGVNISILLFSPHSELFVFSP